ncbi:PREDICTED: nuclear speckle splicing regulatory protein 1 [Vollenhovia emeryi]|uniref:nuclear speckle splicing regulatory protein 1 n=1 Tax=Vollenhovia emeryi TaxID=411798 RepID=UPI0005F39A82|nr:PREDICTED: nuclear speckle splicing regulatory protein 1 [Vollenhovia emeryi]
MANKQFGLILAKKQQKQQQQQQQSTAPRLGNVFGDDDASDEDDGTDWVRKALKAEGEKNRVKRQTRLDMQKALDEDPTIYQYDEVYDDLERGKGQSDGASKQKEKSKYIQRLLKTAERRKKEQEHRIERMVQKEREAEGEMYADKESFVTSAYRAKLEEFKKMEEEEAKMNRLEAIGDVTKQQDMSGFYRHLYEQTVDYKGKGDADEGGTGKAEEASAEQRKRKTSTSSANEESANRRADETAEGQRAITRSKKSRQYRQRAVEAYESDSETETGKEEPKKDQTVVSPVDGEAGGAEARELEEKKQKLGETRVEDAADNQDKDTGVRDAEVPRDDTTPEDEKAECKEEPVEKKDRSSIWEKRTVGPVFEAALERYYARKAKRLVAAN